MRLLLSLLLLSTLIFSCEENNSKIVDKTYADSLVKNYKPSVTQTTQENNLSFWKKRMNSLPDNFVNGPGYAAALIANFRITGSIENLITADSLYQQTNNAYKGNEPSVLRTIAGIALLRHQFSRADSFLKKAILIEGITYQNSFLDFDISFERGEFNKAKQLLKRFTEREPNSFGVLFRRSKFEHYDGSLDTSISCMLQAAKVAGNNKGLQQVALSNAGDLYVHKGNLKKAYEQYKKSLAIDAADLHSLMGIGWIALAHDKNDTVAEHIFKLVKEHTQSPDVLLKLIRVAEMRNDSVLQQLLAREFEKIVTNPMYGGMYNKYLIDLYTGILYQPSKAVMLAKEETMSRPTPQAFAWYVFSLLNNGKKDEAYRIFKEIVSGQPLEGPELYYMGKLMQALDKGYNAQQFFKAAEKNKYDLSISQQKDLAESLE